MRWTGEHDFLDWDRILCRCGSADVKFQPEGFVENVLFRLTGLRIFTCARCNWTFLAGERRRFSRTGVHDRTIIRKTL